MTGLRHIGALGGDGMARAGVLAMVACVLAGCATNPPEVVPHVDLQQYSGTWYEIARFPNFFQSDCAGGTTATYRLREDGQIDVINRCRTSLPDGKIKEVTGVARLASDTPEGKLCVRFGLFWSTYWIVAMDAEDYQWSVVSDPSRSVLWILHRKREMEPELYNRLVVDLAERGFEVDRLIRTPQPPEADTTPPLPAKE